MKPQLVALMLLIIGGLCSCSQRTQEPPVPTAAVAPEVSPLPIAAKELQSRGQELHDRLQYSIVEKDWGWIVTVGNLTGSQPKGQAYMPGDAAMMKISKEGSVVEFQHMP